MLWDMTCGIDSFALIGLHGHTHAEQTFRLLAKLAESTHPAILESVIHGLKRISSPGLRIYVGADEITDVHSGLGISILSTSRGIMTGARAKKAKVGGELLAQIW